MTTSPCTSTPTLIHLPYGEQHPYLPLPCERAPRDPAAGEPVTLGVETGHQPSADLVWCEWQVAGSPAIHHAQAISCVPGETTDAWQVRLPAFSGGDTVTYRLFASGTGFQTETDAFTFSVSEWVDVVSASVLETSMDKLRIELATGKLGLFVHLEIAPEPTGTVTLKYSVAGTGTGAQTGNGEKPITSEFCGLRVKLSSYPFQISIIRESDGMALCTSEPLRLLVSADGRVLQYKFSFESPSDEAFYGFGERFNALDQRGNTLDNYVYHQYTSQGKCSYIPVPFFISSRGYGMWLKTQRQAWFDLASSSDTRFAITGSAEDEDGELELKLFFQNHPRAIVQAFTTLTGKPKLPPTWVFGLWMSSNDWNSQSVVLRQLQKTQEAQIPSTVLVIEAWSDEISFYIWNDAQYQIKDASQGYCLDDFTFPPDGRWPDPKAMTDEIHQAGLRLVLWQNPLIKHGETRENLDETLNKADQAYAVQQGYVVTKADGSPHRVEPHAPWFKNSLVLDFTNPQAVDWWFKKREYLVTEIGVDGFKTDGGEHIWDVETHFSDGSRGSRGINQYPLDYELAYQRFMEAYRGDDYVLFSRAGYTGAQQVPCHWLGDEKSTWDAYRASIRAMLNVGICGVPFMGWDLAGFSGPIPGSELYLRAAAFSVFCPIMQYHSDVNHQRKPSRDRTPWNIQEQTGSADVLHTFREFANLRMNLLPYILSQAAESSRTGLPLTRALPLEYPQDAACRAFPYEYLLGDALLVAPVTQEGIETMPVYLPEGEWRDFWTGDIYQGPLTIETAVPLNRIPVFQKKGSILALNLDESGRLGSYVGNRTDRFDHLALQIFPGEFTEATLHIPPVRVAAERRDGQIILDLPALSQAVDLLVIDSQPTSVTNNGRPYPALDTIDGQTASNGWFWDNQIRGIRIYLPASAQETRLEII